MIWGNHQHAQPSCEVRSVDNRGMQRVRLGDTSLELEVMIHRTDLADRVPLLIINSIDFPMPPSHEFCEKMWAAGYQVIFVRRPGFGNTRALPTILMGKTEVKNHAPIAMEAVLIKLLIETLQLKNIRLLGLGTSNSVCLRLAQISNTIDQTVFSNPLFHPAIWDVIRPPWLKRMIRQTVISRSGLKIAVQGLRAVLRRDPIWFYRQFAQKSAGDLAYVDANETDFRDAGLFLQEMSPDLYYYELKSALVEDTSWNPQTCGTINAIILSVVETTTDWKTSITTEADRLGLPIVFAGAGDLFVPYASPDVLLEILELHRAKAEAG